MNQVEKRPMGMSDPETDASETGDGDPGPTVVLLDVLPNGRPDDDRPAHRIIRTPTFDVREECIAPGAEPVGLLLIRQRRSQIVDDLIGVPREAVERVDVGPLAGWKQQRG